MKKILLFMVLTLALPVFASLPPTLEGKMLPEERREVLKILPPELQGRFAGIPISSFEAEFLKKALPHGVSQLTIAEVKKILPEIVELIKEKEGIESLNSFLLQAIAAHDTEFVTSLLEKGVSPDVKDSVGRTALMLAAYLGFSDLVTTLLMKGAHVDAQDSYKRTALIEAMRGKPHGAKPEESRVNVVKAVLNYNPKLTRDAAGKTVLDYAVEYKDQPVIEALKKHEKDGTTFLMQAAMNDDLGSAKLLLDKGAAIDAQNKDGMTALMFAAEKGFKPMIKLLLNRGADVNKRTNEKEGKNAAILAALHGYVSLLGELPVLYNSLGEEGQKYLKEHYEEAKD